MGIHAWWLLEILTSPTTPTHPHPLRKAVLDVHEAHPPCWEWGETSQDDGNLHSGLIRDSQQKPTSAKLSKTSKQTNLLKEYQILMENSLGGMQSVLKPDSKLKIRPRDWSWVDISELWRHISVLTLHGVVGTLQTQHRLYQNDFCRVPVSSDSVLGWCV